MTGKTELICRLILLENYFYMQYEPTFMESMYKSNIYIEGKLYNLELLDTAGSEEYYSLMDMWVSLGDSFMLVFAVDDKESFETTKKRREKIIKQKRRDVYQMILVGSKQDLENERKVSYNEAKALADSWGISYIETSAKTNYNCKESFEILIKDFIRSKNKNKKKKTIDCIIF